MNHEQNHSPEKNCCEKCEWIDYERDEYDRGIGLTNYCRNSKCPCHSKIGERTIYSTPDSFIEEKMREHRRMFGITKHIPLSATLNEHIYSDDWLRSTLQEYKEKITTEIAGRKFDSAYNLGAREALQGVLEWKTPIKCGKCEGANVEAHTLACKNNSYLKSFIESQLQALDK